SHRAALRPDARTPRPPILSPPFLILHSFPPPFLHSSTRDCLTCRADARPPPADPPSSFPHPPFLRSSVPPLLFPIIPPVTRTLVVGAGAFGGWTALPLLRRRADVTLIDAWGPGNPCASSGGGTRFLRGTYGDRAIYTRMAARAMRLWREHEERSGRRFFDRIGALWMFGGDAS